MKSRQNMSILQIGNGNMGFAAMKLFHKNDHNVKIIDKNLANNKDFEVFSDFSSVQNETFDLIIIAVKPQDFEKIANEVNKICTENTIILSIMAGTSIKNIQKSVKNTTKFIRVMPNLGILTNTGVSLVYGNCNLDNIYEIFNQNGNIAIKLQNEEEISKITPLTGSGMAILLLLAEKLQKYAMENFGFTAETWQQILPKILETAGNMSKNGDYLSAISKIASKKGITEAMILRIDEDLGKIAKSAMIAGELRANELDS